MRVATFEEIAPEFIARAHGMVWCDMATVGPDGRPRTRILHPVWDGDTAWATSLRVGPKADDVDRNPYVSLAYISDPHKPAYAECVASWEDDRERRIEIWKWIASLPEPLGYVLPAQTATARVLDAIGVQLDDIRSTKDVMVAPREIVAAGGTIPKGRISSMRARIEGVVQVGVDAVDQGVGGLVRHDVA